MHLNSHFWSIYDQNIKIVRAKISPILGSENCSLLNHNGAEILIPSITAQRLQNFFVDISNNTHVGQGQQCAHDDEPYLPSETRAYVCPSAIFGRYVTIRFGSNTEQYLQLCEVQVMARTNRSGCRQTGLACTAGRPQELTASSGIIASPTMYNVGNYPPNADCVWRITVPSNKVSNRFMKETQLGIIPR